MNRVKENPIAWDIYKKKKNKCKKEWKMRNAEKVKEQRDRWYAKYRLDPAWRAKKKDADKSRYMRIKNDPVKYAAYLEAQNKRARNRYARKQLETNQ